MEIYLKENIVLKTTPKTRLIVGVNLAQTLLAIVLGFLLKANKLGKTICNKIQFPLKSCGV